MHRALRPAFVLTLATLTPACSKPKPSESATTGPAPTVATTLTEEEPQPPPPRGGPPPPDPNTRMRPMRAPLPETAATTPPMGPKRPLNPVLEGRSVYAGNGGYCFVLLPAPPDAPPVPPGGDNSVRKNVDCPEEMMDPAWDTCLHGTLSTDGKLCDCWRPGNPPPPPRAAECPKSVK